MKLQKIHMHHGSGKHKKGVQKASIFILRKQQVPYDIF